MGERSSRLAAMGIDEWCLRRPRGSGGAAQAVKTSRPAAPELAVARSPVITAQVGDRRSDIAVMSWEALRAAVAVCRACPLHAGRTQTVFGVGDRHAEWLFIGEAPGAEEDRQGEPFVGRAGQLLNSILFALGMSRERVYIANILKCRPPRNRDPEPSEAHCCRPFLDRQIELIAPQVIVALGRIAAQQLLQTDTPIGRLRGRVHRYALGERSIPMIVTYHPAYLLRSPQEKAKVWADLRLARGAAVGGAP